MLFELNEVDEDDCDPLELELICETAWDASTEDTPVEKTILAIIEENNILVCEISEI